MINIPQICPHCLTERAAFSGANYVTAKPGMHIYLMLLQCGVCGEGIVAKFEGAGFPTWVQGYAGNVNVKLVETWPKPLCPKAPEYVPEHVASFYFQAMDNLARRNWDAAGAMFRKSLETGLKTLNPGGKGTLYDRINSIPPEIGLTSAMKEWAHEIRRLGADAAHDEDPFTEKEAKSLQPFTELFLTYAFMLPGMLGAKKTDPKDS